MWYLALQDCEWFYAGSPESTERKDIGSIPWHGLNTSCYGGYEQYLQKHSQCCGCKPKCPIQIMAVFLWLFLIEKSIHSADNVRQNHQFLYQKHRRQRNDSVKSHGLKRNTNFPILLICRRNWLHIHMSVQT